jgi:fibronectin type 3 domain-containing protein
VTATPTAPPSGGSMQVPPVPMGLQATAGNAQVMLTWMTSTGATAYHLSRATASGGPWVQIAAPATNAFTDTEVTNGTRYYYVVAAGDAAGASADSAPPVSATPRTPQRTAAPSASPRRIGLWRRKLPETPFWQSIHGS